MRLKWWQQRRRKLDKMQVLFNSQDFYFGHCSQEISLSNPRFSKVFSYVFIRNFVVLYKVCMEGFFVFLFFCCLFFLSIWGSSHLSSLLKRLPFLLWTVFSLLLKNSLTIGLGQFLYCVLFWWSILSSCIPYKTMLITVSLTRVF